MLSELLFPSDVFMFMAALFPSGVFMFMMALFPSATSSCSKQQPDLRAVAHLLVHVLARHASSFKSTIRVELQRKRSGYALGWRNDARGTMPETTQANPNKVQRKFLEWYVITGAVISTG